MLAEFILNVDNILNFIATNDPIFLTVLGIMGCTFMILFVVSIPLQWYRKCELNLLKDKIDILVSEYKVEVTQTINRQKH